MNRYHRETNYYYFFFFTITRENAFSTSLTKKNKKNGYKNYWFLVNTTHKCSQKTLRCLLTEKLKPLNKKKKTKKLCFFFLHQWTNLELLHQWRKLWLGKLEKIKKSISLFLFSFRKRSNYITHVFVSLHLLMILATFALSSMCELLSFSFC